MSFAESVARGQEAIFRALGEDAEWQGVADPVRVIRRETDDDLQFNDGALIQRGRTLRVRRSEVPSPQDGHAVEILDGSGAAFVVTGEPRLDRKGVWHCQIVEA